MIKTAYGTVSTDETGTEVSGEFGQLHDWASRPGARWPSSDLAVLDAISANFDARGDLVDLRVTYDGKPVCIVDRLLGIVEVGADELDAWVSDVLRAAGLNDHPAIRGEAVTA